MSAAFTCICIPFFKPFIERIAILKGVAASLSPADLDDLAQEDITADLDEINEAIDALADAFASPECSIHYLGGKYPIAITGGISGGHPPTSIYECFETLVNTPPIWKKMVEWAMVDDTTQPTEPTPRMVANWVATEVGTSKFGPIYDVVEEWSAALIADSLTPAQAHLIAASPDLLAACQAVIDAWETGDLAAAARRCSAAITKAKGGAS